MTSRALPVRSTTYKRQHDMQDEKLNYAASQAPVAPVVLSTQTILLYSLTSSVLLWAAFPPLNFGWLGWFATVPWIALALRNEPISRRGYAMIWLAGFLHWAALLQGVRLAHPALYPGWLLLSAYLAVYFPLFVGWSRCLLAYRVPAVLALPITWVALEYFRAYFVTGFSTASLSHTQVDFALLLQIADLAGAYTLSFLMMVVTTSLVLWWPRLAISPKTRLLSTAFAANLLIGSLIYGYFRLHALNANKAPGKPAARILLVQGCVDTVLDNNPERPRQMIEHYRRLTFDHLSKPEVKQAAPYDLIVWPESACAYPDFVVAPNAQAPPESGLTQETFRENLAQHEAGFTEMLRYFSERFNETHPGHTSFLTGVTTVAFGDKTTSTYNAALLISPTGQPVARYYKSHLVMFGEYIPIAEWFPWIYQLTPLPGGLSRGKEPTAFALKGLSFAPNVCFESTVPQLIRRQVNTLAAKNQEPDVLMNNTNDGWFYGSAILDLHFQCAIMRAVENRKPFLIAANTGIGGVIDGNGRVLERGPNHATALLTTDVQADGRTSLYRTLGDWPAFACWVVTLLAAIGQWRERKV